MLNSGYVRDLKKEFESFNVKDSYSGGLVTFNGIENMPLQKCVSNIDPVQDLHGYDSPWIGGTGKNKISFLGVSSKTNNGVTYTANADGSIKIQNQATALSFGFDSNTATLPAGNYVLSTHNMTDVRTVVAGDGVSDVFVDGDGSKAFTLAVETAIYVYPRVSNGTTPDVTNGQIQIESGNQATTYAPFENLCPIIGWSECNVTRASVNIWDEQWETGGISSITGTDASSTSRYRSIGYIKVVPLQEIYIVAPDNLGLRLYDKCKSFLRAETGVANSTYTVPSDAYFIRFVNTFASTYGNNVSFNYPSSNHSYCAYNGTTRSNVWLTNLFGGAYGSANKCAIPANVTAMKFSADSQGTYALNGRWYDSSGTKVGSDFGIVSIGNTYGTAQGSVPSGATQFIIFSPNSGKTVTFSNVMAYDSSSIGVIYGGTMDVATGVLTVDRKCVYVTGASLVDYRSFAGAVGYNVNSALFADANFNKAILCNKLETISPSEAQHYGACKWSGNSFYFWFQDGAFADFADAVAKTDAAGLQCCYYLATPLTYQLTPQQIKALTNNNIWADTGDIYVEYGEFMEAIKNYADRQIAVAQAQLS